MINIWYNTFENLLVQGLLQMMPLVFYLQEWLMNGYHWILLSFQICEYIYKFKSKYIKLTIFIKYIMFSFSIYFPTYFEQLWSWFSTSWSKDSSCSVSWVKRFFCSINVKSLFFNWESRRAIINSTAFRISLTLSSFAALTDSTLRSYRKHISIQARF